MSYILNLVNIFCILFTTYFIVCIILETHRDLKDETASTKWAFQKKFAKKFMENFLYRLP